MCISSLRKLYPCIDCQCGSTVDLNAVTTGLHHPVCSLTVPPRARRVPENGGAAACQPLRCVRWLSA